MSQPAGTPLRLHTALSLACLVVAVFAVPSSVDLWRRVLVWVFSVTLGHQMAVALLSGRSGGATAARSWLECLSFPLLMMAVLQVPSTQGWVLAVAGLLWRPLVGRLVR